MLTGNLSRRDFLKMSSATLLSLMFAEPQLDSTEAAAEPMQGRVQATTLFVRDAPAYSGKKISR